MKLAQVNFNAIQSASGVGLQVNSVGELVTKLIPYLLGFGGILLLLNLLYGGISMMLSRGEPKAYEGAKGRVTASLIGFIIVFAAYWIVQIVATMLKLDAIKSMFP